MHAPRRALTALLAFTSMVAVSCGGSTPTAPPPVPPPPAPPANNLPVIDAIVVQGTRPKEPAAFADVGESVPIVARVHDDETAADQLDYQWSATAGAFAGSGANVVWQAPATATTPLSVTITLKVVEKYGFPGQTPAFQHDVTGTTTLSLHDSISEVGTMSRQFLLDFSDSNIRSADDVLRNFSTGPRCTAGRSSEFDDVVKNRTLYRIESYEVGAAAVTIAFASRPCSFRPLDGDACSVVHTIWQSLCLQTNPECSAGDRTRVEGLDYVTAVYEQSQWRLCASNYGPIHTLVLR